MAYYRDSVTQASWQLLTQLKKNYDFILIGGWAVWLYTRNLKSKDIDIVIKLSELAKLRDSYELEKNIRLKKYQFRQQETEVDVYVPFFSFLGLPVEEIIKKTEIIDGFKVPKKEQLLILKTVAWFDRRGSLKGRKDWMDIVSLLTVMPNKKLSWPEKLGPVKQLVFEQIKTTVRLPDLKLNEHQFKRLKPKWLNLLS